MEYKFEDGDPTTFTAVSQGSKSEFAYAKDSKHVYLAYLHEASQIDGADPKSFTILDQGGWYSKDQNHAYYIGAEIDGADAATFRTLSFGFARDVHRAFIGNLEIPISDIKSFEPLNIGNGDEPWKRQSNRFPRSANWIKKKTTDLLASGWSRDASAVYYGARKLPNADSKTFKALSRFYGKDANNVFAGETVIARADAATFEIDPKAFNEFGIRLGPGPDARDKDHTYSDGKMLK